MNLFGFHIYNYMKGAIFLKQTDINSLIEKYGKKVYNFCLRLCQNIHDADDLYQDTFLKAMEKISSIDENINPSAYLCTIAISLHKSKLRKESRRATIAPVSPIEEALVSSSGETPEGDMLKNEMYREIRAAVDSLDEKLRPCVLMHYIADMSIDEIAKALNLPEGTVKSRLFTARNTLRNKIITKGEEI